MRGTRRSLDRSPELRHLSRGVIARWAGWFLRGPPRPGPQSLTTRERPPAFARLYGGRQNSRQARTRERTRDTGVRWLSTSPGVRPCSFRGSGSDNRLPIARGAPGEVGRGAGALGRWPDGPSWLRVPASAERLAASPPSIPQPRHCPERGAAWSKGHAGRGLGASRSTSAISETSQPMGLADNASFWVCDRVRGATLKDSPRPAFFPRWIRWIR